LGPFFSLGVLTEYMQSGIHICIRSRIRIRITNKPHNRKLDVIIDKLQNQQTTEP